MSNLPALRLARDWASRQYSRRSRDDRRHPSFLADEILLEADEKFGLDSYGVEGWARSPTKGVSYLKFGDSYDPTIVVQTSSTGARFFLAIGGWAAYA
jgi:hypothetical protein